MKMQTYNISINPELAQVVEKEIKQGKYANRSEFFRDLIRKFLLQEEQKEQNLLQLEKFSKNQNINSNEYDFIEKDLKKLRSKVKENIFQKV